MSQNKQQISRIKVINRCLCNGGYWTKQRLIKEISEIDINICERTLDNDISLMRNSQQLKYNAPIQFCKTNKGYHYTDSNYSIDKLPLNDIDIKKLELAATTLKQYQYIPLMNEFTTTIDKIIRVVNRAKQSNHESILDFIEFEKTPVALGLNFIDTLIDCIQHKTALLLEYKKFGSDISSSQIVHPYFLKEYRNRWYVIAYNQPNQKIQTYGLDRIMSLAESNALYIENTMINTKEYLGSCVGINLMEQKIETVRLLFTPKEGYYLKTQALHKSQKIIEDNPQKGLLLDYDLIINYEFIGILLSYGSDIKVIAPASLADKVVEISKRNIKQYSEVN